MEGKRDDYQSSEVRSERVKAGKRTYFFDVKATRGKDYYLTITESKRKPTDEGFQYEKHKIFLYKEDFDKFLNALSDSVAYIRDHLLKGSDSEAYNSSYSPRVTEEGKTS